jgi:MFS transporter, ACS family, hexuronate transporter
MQPENRGKQWLWWVSLLLLLATMINYMDRQTLANLAPAIKLQFKLSNEQYGNIESLFGKAFAFGSLFFGLAADRVSVRLLYPCVLLAWSAVGFATGLTGSYNSLLVCRGLLGFFEAGHWPCALVVTQSVLARGDRAMGNSVLQSGASLGAILTPIIIVVLTGGSEEPDAWRPPFLIIGSVGVVWAILWLWIVRPNDLPSRRDASSVEPPVREWLVSFFSDRRFWALAAMVISINSSWQLIRAWLPMFLQEGRSYTKGVALSFNSVYYIATDVGCILAGIATLWLVRRGTDVHRSRVIVFAVCALLAGTSTIAAMLPAGPLLLGILLLVAAGTLGVFPCYYSFTQEFSTQHMGKLTGMLSFLGWYASSYLQPVFGRWVDETGSFDLGVAVVGWAPMFGLLIFLLLWPRRVEPTPETSHNP